jgi:hypothetical protein
MLIQVWVPRTPLFLPFKPDTLTSYDTAKYPLPPIELHPSVSYAWNYGFQLLLFNLIFGDLDISWQPYKHKNQIMQQKKKKKIMVSNSILYLAKQDL